MVACAGAAGKPTAPGILPVEPDGKFGDVTMQAVKKFQRDHGLKADGVVGWGTHNKL